MIVLEGCHTDHKVVSNTMQVSRFGNGQAETNVHGQSDPTLIQGFNGRQGNLGSGGIVASICHDDDGSGDVSGTSANGIAGKSYLGQHEDLTLQDIYNKEGDFDSEDDSDWDPLEKQLENHITIVKWFCINCTMVNFGDTLYCHICGEHKESGILRHGFLASPLQQADSIQNIPLKRNGESKASSSQTLAPHKLTAVGFDDRMLLHYEAEKKSVPHPERPDRLRAIAASLATAGIFPGRCHAIPAREITREELKTVHSDENITSVELTSQCFSSYFTSDTYANNDSALAARLAAGLCADLASAIYSGRAKNGFALVRPPGHHAGVKHAMGFCLHNNAAVAALAAQAAGAKKVLIVDWDVHHGNGTQEIFEQNKTVLYISLHRHEGGQFYPGTGAAHEVGSMGGEGYCVNVPWSRGGVGDNDYIFAFEHVVLPIARKFAPDITIISAGFDAARGDPLGCCDVTPAGYAQMTKMLTSLSSGKLLVILEGGYNLRSISASATAVIKVLLGESPESMLENVVPSRSGLRTVLDVLKIQNSFWPNLESILSDLLAQWGSYALQEIKKKKKLGFVVPPWWKVGRKKFLHHILSEQLRVKSRRRMKASLLLKRFS
ncbi:histone deacetylase 15 [Artemisia annua]|uniref:histone deacetylase n=1 Tax=Artemisia annua TaxID=35608 RepID=A0A2U1NDS3_ARTAN|nr:histone deacetylase 15 [Artemisia annua]